MRRRDGVHQRDLLSLLSIVHLRVSFASRERLTDEQRSELHARIERRIAKIGGAL